MDADGQTCPERRVIGVFVCVYGSVWLLALLKAANLHLARYYDLLPVYYEPDHSVVVAPSTELVLVPPAGGRLVVMPSPPVAIVEERLPSILSRALATRLRCTSAKPLSPLFTALQPSIRSVLA
jgi:hypothetical protein